MNTWDWSWSWAPAVAIVAVLALLLAFGQVVRSVVQQGEFRRRAEAQYADGLWRCNALNRRRLRDVCLTRLDGPAASGDAPAIVTRLEP